jgi:hypothetical protein
MALHPGADLEELMQRAIDVVFEWFMGAIVLAVDDEENVKTFLSAALHEIGGF